MNKVIVCMCLFLAALTGTASAQAPSTDASVPNPNLTSMAPEEACVAACRYLINDSSCHPRADVYNCVAEHPACAGNRPRIVSAVAALYLEDSDCPATPEATTRPRRTTTRRSRPATTTTTTTTSTAPVTAPATDPTGLTYITPAIPIIGDGAATHDDRARRAQQLCEELGGVWYAEGRTGDPSRERLASLIRSLIVTDRGPGGGPETDTNPGICLTPEGVALIEVLRYEIEERRVGDATLNLRVSDLQRQIDELNALVAELAAARAQPTADTSAYEARIRELEERMRQQEARYADALQELYNAIRLYRDARERSASRPADDPRRSRVQIPRRDPNRHRLTGERLGFIAEGAFSISRYQLVAHRGSNSPKFLGLGAGLTIRLVDHLYFASVIDLGVGLRDGRHVHRQFEAHYRVGMLGVVANHVLVGGAFASHHRYSGSGALGDQDGPWYQYRFRGAELEAGYIWRERGLSPFISLQVGLGQGQHADRRLTNDEPDGRHDRFETFFGIRAGVMRLRAR